MRCKPEVVENPYKGISITGLSHNRAGLSHDILCNPNDVLYNIKPEDPFEIYLDKVVCTLKIKSLNYHHKYHKEFTESKNGQYFVAVIELIHKPVPCMYPHVVFRVCINNEIITYNNHESTLKKLHKLRNSLKEELASMIVKRQVSQHDFPTA